jgi:hypothetical protein
MELSLERVADAVAALRSEGWERPDLERRTLPRFRVWMPRTIELVGAPGGGTEPMEVWFIDIACGGVGFLASRRFETGQQFYVSIPGLESASVRLLCRVARCLPAQNGTYTVGARFVEQGADAGAASGVPVRQAS